MQASIPLVVSLIILAFLISLPCGYIRQKYEKFSFMWFLLIHIPIPFIVMLRLRFGLDWHFIPLTLGGSIAGQIVGASAKRRRNR
jgi:hypothetical protein